VRTREQDAYSIPMDSLLSVVRISDLSIVVQFESEGIESVINTK